MSRNALRIALGVVLGVGAVVAWQCGPVDPESVRGHGRISVVLFVLVYAGATMLPVPKAVFSLAGGALFGLAVGLPATLAGATLGAGAAFMIGRLLGRDLVERHAGPRVAWLDSMFRRHGVFAVIALRLLPLVPFTALNYAAGLTSLRWRSYLVGTALGIAPGAAVYTLLGAYGREPGSWPFRIALVGLGALTLAALLLARRHERRRGGVAAASPPASG